ncbi:GerMN domain-containing protein [Paracidobacterium acidisoli]|nr:GerMN domain-containing protein [Paracidobacterium acidisoli]MBT9332769.1 GerMN domain-containing protein [Paracidobacterium acidisoli]
MSALVSKAQRILIGLMLLACVVMAAVLIRLRERAHDRLQAVDDTAPALIEPDETPAVSVTLLVPNDLDDSLTEVHRSLSLPQDESARARVLIERLMDAFAAKSSTHPVAVTSGVQDVFLMPVPQSKDASAPAGELAVVNLTSAFAEAQPSGIEPETLTLLSILATLHTNLPSITEVRFLVDGQQRDTLAGHADLTRTYLASETSPEPTR